MADETTQINFSTNNENSFSLGSKRNILKTTPKHIFKKYYNYSKTSTSSAVVGSCGLWVPAI